MENDKELMKVIDLSLKQLLEGRFNPVISDKFYKKIIISMCEASFTSGEIKGSAETINSFKEDLKYEKKS